MNMREERKEVFLCVINLSVCAVAAACSPVPKVVSQVHMSMHKVRGDSHTIALFYADRHGGGGRLGDLRGQDCFRARIYEN